MPTLTLLPLLLMTLAVPSTAAAARKAVPAKEAVAEPAQECDAQTSIVVKVRYPNGDREEYRRELDSMELVFDETGRLSLIHLVLFSGPEKDTHKWLQFQNLSNFAYRFCNVSGKGKVRLSVLQPFYREGGAPVQEQGKGLSAPELPPVTPKDYR